VCVQVTRICTLSSMFDDHRKKNWWSFELFAVVSRSTICLLTFNVLCVFVLSARFFALFFLNLVCFVFPLCCLVTHRWALDNLRVCRWMDGGLSLFSFSPIIHLWQPCRCCVACFCRWGRMSSLVVVTFLFKMMVTTRWWSPFRCMFF